MRRRGGREEEESRLGEQNEKFESGCNKIINKNFRCCRKKARAPIDEETLRKTSANFQLRQPYFDSRQFVETIKSLTIFKNMLPEPSPFALPFCSTTFFLSLFTIAEKQSSRKKWNRLLPLMVIKCLKRLAPRHVFCCANCFCLNFPRH